MRQTAVLAAVLVFGSVAYAADPQLLNLVMPDAKILAGANGTSIRISPFGQYIISQVSTLGLEPQKLVQATGFDPLQDITEVLAATNAAGANSSNLLLVEGTFDVEKIVAAVTAQNKNAQVTTAPGATVIAFTNPKTNKTAAVGFIGSSIAALGPMADVQAAITRSAGAASSIDPSLVTQVNQISANEDEWVVSTVSVASLLPANTTTNAQGPAAQVLPILQKIQSFSGGVKFADNVVLTGQAVSTDAQNANALASVVKLAASLASMGAGNNAQLTQFAQLLQTLQVNTDGATVSVSLSVPESQAEAALNMVLKRPTPNAAPAEEHLHRGAKGN